MIGWSRCLGVRSDERAKGKRRNTTASTDIRRPFVKHDEHHAVLQHGSTEERVDERAQPSVAGRDITVVHVVTEIGNDERKRRQASTANIGQEPAKRHDPLEPRRRQVAPKVDERVVLLCVTTS
jgi:hypothetical protein